LCTYNYYYYWNRRVLLLYLSVLRPPYSPWFWISVIRSLTGLASHRVSSHSDSYCVITTRVISIIDGVDLPETADEFLRQYDSLGSPSLYHLDVALA
jgi:hypothetical protein